MTTKGKKSGGSQADGTRRSYFMYNPFTELVITGIDTDDGPEHPNYDERIKIPLTHPKLAALIESIKRHGVREPVKFKRDGDSNITEEGRQRVRCAREATLQLRAERVLKANEVIWVPAMPWQGSYEDSYMIARSMNACRVDNDAMANAKEAAVMLGWGKPKQVVANAMGVTPATIDEWQALLGATPAVQRAVARRDLSPTAAAKIARLPSADQPSAVAKLLEGGKKPTVRDATNKVREVSGQAPTETPSSRLRRIIAELRGFDAATHDAHRLIEQIKAHAGIGPE